MSLFDGWKLKKANPDAERNHLNKILKEAETRADAAVVSVSPGTGIDVDSTDINNPVVSVEASIVSGASLGATALQSGDNVSELVNDAGYITGATAHNSLSGLQGGTTDEYYHLTAVESAYAETLATALQLVDYPAEILPSASPAGRLIFVSDETGGPVPAFSDGTNWRRVTDRAIVSI